MIRVDTHGREWIMKHLGMKDNHCPECQAAPSLRLRRSYISVSKPQESATEHWFDCECKRCGCEWVVKYETEIED